MTARYSTSSEKPRPNASERQQGPECANRLTFAELISQLVYDDNLFIRCELVRLERLLETLCEEPSDEAMQLADLARAFAGLKTQLTTLMEFEEETLFPLITRVERTPIVAVDSPEAIGMMTAAKRQADAYEESMTTLARVRNCALTYEPPSDAPILFSCVLYDLAGFDEELRARVKTKNDLLRRAVVELPLRRPRKSAQRASRRDGGAAVRHHA